MISEKGIKKSFRMAKKDISELQYEVSRLIENQKALKEKLAKLEQKKAAAKPKKAKPAKKKTVKKVAKKTAPKKAAPKKKVAKTYVATKDGKKFHTKNCPFAQNILPKHKVLFRSKTKALNEGYKACNCVK